MSPREETTEIVCRPPAMLPPREFDFSKPERWPQWVRRFERYMLIADLTRKSDLEKINALCRAMGAKSKEILAQIIPGGIKIYTRYKTVKSKLNDYFVPKKNVNAILVERFKFNTRTQQIGESVDTFIADLYALAETCDFGALKDDLIRDRIVVGIGDSLTSRFLQLLTDLTVTKAIEVVREAEEHNRSQAREENRIERSLLPQFSWKQLIVNSDILRSHIASVIDAIPKSPMPEFVRQVSAGLEIPTRLRMIHKLVIHGMSLDRYEGVVPLGKWFLRDVEESSGRNHPDVAAMKALLALVYRNQSKYEEAENLLNDALAIRIKIFGETHNAVASTLNNLAELYCKQGNFEEAERMSMRALVIYERMLVNDLRDVAKQLNNYAILCEIQEKHEDAERYFQQALEIYEAKHSPDNYFVFNTKFNLIDCYQKLGKTEEAFNLLEQTMTRFHERALDYILD